MENEGLFFSDKVSKLFKGLIVICHRFDWLLASKTPSRKLLFRRTVNIKSLILSTCFLAYAGQMARSVVTCNIQYCNKHLNIHGWHFSKSDSEGETRAIEKTNRSPGEKGGLSVGAKADFNAWSEAGVIDFNTK